MEVNKTAGFGNTARRLAKDAQGSLGTGQFASNIHVVDQPSTRQTDDTSDGVFSKLIRHHSLFLDVGKHAAEDDDVLS